MLTLPKAAVRICAVFAVAMFVWIPFSASSPIPAEAQERTVSDGLTMIALDLTMSRLRDLEAAQMAATLVLSQTPRGLIAVGEYGESPDDPRTFSTTEEAQQEVRNVISRMRDAIQASPDAELPPAGLNTMLTRYASYMEQINAPPGSKLVLLSAGDFADPENTTPATVAVLADGFSSGGILVDGVSLATTAAPDRAIIETIADETGGSYFDLGFNDGVLEFLNATLGIGLREIFRGEPQGRSPLTSTIDVLPHSTNLVAGFVYEGADIDTTLISPSGQRLAAGSTTVDVLSASGIHVFTVLDPEPGQWTMESIGGSGPVLFVSEILNPIVLGPPVMAIGPVGKPWTMYAESTADGAPHVDTTASLVAEVTGPGGSVRILQMYDDGMGNDQLANDGTYAADLEADDAPGVRDVHLRMSWPVTPATVEGWSSYSLEPFPEAQLTAVESDFGLGGTDFTLAMVEVLLDGAPYPVDVQVLDISVTDGGTGEPYEFGVAPTNGDTGSSSSFRVSADVEESVRLDVAASVNLTYAERELLLEAGAVTIVAELDTLPPPNRTPLFLAFAAVVVVVAGGAVWWFFGRVKPSGFVYMLDVDSPQELVVDFSASRFSLLDSILRSNVVPAASLSGLPLRGGQFVFGRSAVHFRYNPERDGDIRLNIDGAPVAAGRNQLSDGSEMTIAGINYRFSKTQLAGEIRVSMLLSGTDTEEHDELSRFTNDPMTFDAPSSIRPTRRS